MNEGNENWKGKQIGEVYTLDKNTPHLFFQLFYDSIYFAYLLVYNNTTAYYNNTSAKKNKKNNTMLPHHKQRQ